MLDNSTLTHGTPNEEGGGNEHEAEQDHANGGQDPAKTIVAILPPKVLICICIINMVVTFGMICVCLVYKELVATSFARALVILWLSISLGLFTFILYPHKMQIRLPLLLGVAVQFAGPLAVVVALFLFLDNRMPVFPEWHTYIQKEIDVKGTTIYLSNLSKFGEVTGVEKLSWHRVTDTSGNYQGFCVYFPNNIRRYDVNLHPEPGSPVVPVVLSRSKDKLEVRKGDKR